MDSLIAVAVQYIWLQKDCTKLIYIYILLDQQSDENCLHRLGDMCIYSVYYNFYS